MQDTGHRGIIRLMSTTPISVLLATFNGATYLQQQLDSLAGQTLLPTELIIGDDGSLDETREIVTSFARTSPFPVRVMPTQSSRLGVCNNFARLMGEARGDYLLFCDQDDIWQPDKIELSLTTLQHLENGGNIPCLVHTDLTVINAAGKMIAPSFWAYQNLDPALSIKLNTALAQNVATGCTMAVNRSLLEAVCPFPPVGPLMHDWWLLLTTLALGGKVGYITQPTVCYRQHAANVVGAKEWSLSSIPARVLTGTETRERIRASQAQAAVLLQRHGYRMSEKNREMVSIYASLATYGPLGRRLKMWRFGIYKSGWQRTVGLYLYV